MCFGSFDLGKWRFGRPLVYRRTMICLRGCKTHVALLPKALSSRLDPKEWADKGLTRISRNSRNACISSERSNDRERVSGLTPIGQRGT